MHEAFGFCSLSDYKISLLIPQHRPALVLCYAAENWNFYETCTWERGEMPKYNECEINCILEKESKSALMCDKPSPPTLKHTSHVCGLLLPFFSYFIFLNK